LPVLYLISLEHFVRFERIVGVITALNVDNPVGNIHSGTFPWTTRSGTARVNLASGAVAFEVDGLVINGAPRPERRE
jgi:hypothetical protein